MVMNGVEGRWKAKEVDEARQGVRGRWKAMEGEEE